MSCIYTVVGYWVKNPLNSLGMGFYMFILGDIVRCIECSVHNAKKYHPRTLRSMVVAIVRSDNTLKRLM
jgi:hypothetical protein